MQFEEIAPSDPTIAEEWRAENVSVWRLNYLFGQSRLQVYDWREHPAGVVDPQF